MCKEVNVVMDFPLVKVEVVLILGQNDNHHQQHEYHHHDCPLVAVSGQFGGETA